ncbi:MAG: Gfo/Idh/MocA family protein [Planctomycetaceae bacterium]
MAKHRRAFLKAAGALSSAAVAANWFAPHVSGQEAAKSKSANDELRIGCIGTGGRCRHLIKALDKIPGLQIMAICDVWDAALAETRNLVHPEASVTKHFEELLAKKDIEAVLIGAPDHQHVPLTIASCQAGKDVYVEKPLTHDPSEGKAVVAAQNQYKRIVQVGTQQRSMPHIQKAKEIIQSGGIGKIRKVHACWNRNSGRATKFQKDAIDPKTVDWKKFLGTAKAQEFDAYRFRQWRWFWDFGGGIFTDLMVHWVDTAHWMLDLDHPLKAVSLGEMQLAQDVWETPDTVQTILRYPNDLQFHFEGTFANANRGALLEFMGSDATLVLDRGGYIITPEKGKPVAPSELILGTGPRGADFYDKPDGEILHLTNWIESIRSRKTPLCPAEQGVASAAAAHLANAALRGSGTADWKKS